jgi:uncharacterized OsmC-like protein
MPGSRFAEEEIKNMQSIQNSSAAATTSNSVLLNGLDTNALTATVAAVAGNPALAPVAFRAKSTWNGRLRSETKIEGYELAGAPIPRSHTIRSDEPHELFGTDSTANPQDLLLAALNACMMVGFVVGATARGITIESLSVESSLALDLRGAFGLDPGIPAGAERIRYTIEVNGSGTREQFEDIHAEVTRNSPNRYHLANPIAFEAELVVR